MQQEYFYDMLKYKPLLFKKLVAKFNHDYENSLPKQVNLEDKNFDFLADNLHIIDYLQLNDFEFNWEYVSNEKILTLLSSKELEKLAYYFGTCMHAKEIALIIQKEELLALKKQIGDNLYTYALEVGQYRLVNLAQIISAFNPELSLIEKIKLHGQEALKLLASNWNEKEKINLPILSENTCPEFQNFDEKQQRSLIFALKKILIKDITSEWQQCLD